VVSQNRKSTESEEFRMWIASDRGRDGKNMAQPVMAPIASSAPAAERARRGHDRNVTLCPAFLCKNRTTDGRRWYGEITPPGASATGYGAPPGAPVFVTAHVSGALTATLQAGRQCCRQLSRRPAAVAMRVTPLCEWA
jgi:hypothetical protein